MAKRIISLLVLFSGLCSVSFGQYLTGTQVSDKDAYQLVMTARGLMPGASNIEISAQNAWLNSLNLSSDDATLVKTQADSFVQVFQNYVDQHNTATAAAAPSAQFETGTTQFYANIAGLASGVQSNLQFGMSFSGYTAIQAYVQQEKNNMQVVDPNWDPVQNPIGGGMVPQYNMYRAAVMDNQGTLSKLNLKIITQGSSYFPNTCVQCFTASHHAYGVNQFVRYDNVSFGYLQYAGPDFAANAYMNYTNTLSVAFQTNCGKATTAADIAKCAGVWKTPNVKVLCSFAGVLATAISFFDANFKGVITYTKVNSLVLPPHCIVSLGLTACVYAVDNFCSNPPPLWSPHTVSTFTSPDPIGYVFRQKGFCFRFTGSSWTCAENPLGTNERLEKTAPPGVCSK